MRVSSTSFLIEEAVTAHSIMSKVASSVKRHDRAIILSCIVGVLISTYGLYVELTKEAHPEYRALCDIAEYASCSKVLTSKYSKGFGVVSKDATLYLPNCIYGLVFYCLIIFLTTFDNVFVVRILFILSSTSVLGCFYLAYLLAFVLHDFCVVCVSTYIVNAFMFYFTYKKLNFITAKNK
ncbi:hypothetical protein K1T71_007851 [Dendrolimus kikuchii]|uniref:Uncharacterized protein n=1 Tax=Dendrolimus kikuchii TaxID=765133 RepID=A0ACC1CYJ6_9NEOP|nr:hypothetical protein K1T71_007851 [Dendrolimus kikuchii]